MKSGLDVMIVSGYEVSMNMGGVGGAPRASWLRCGDHVASLNLLKRLVACDGDLAALAGQLRRCNPLGQLGWPLGGIFLVDFLRKLGLSVDGVGYFAYEKERFRTLAAVRPRIVAISTTFITEVAQIAEIARTAKELSPSSVVVAGGAKVLKSIREYQFWREDRFDGCDIAPMAENNPFFPESRIPEVDAFVVADAGEATLVEIVNTVASGGNLAQVPNLAFHRADGRIVTTPEVEEPDHFAGHVVSWDRVPEGVAGREIPVRGGVGCPFRCAFCDFTGLHRKVRTRPLDRLLNELQLICSAHPGRRVFFTDDNLFCTRRRIRKLCEGIMDRGLKFPWRAFFRADALDEAGADLLARAGCREALLGVESGDDGILAGMDKRSRRETILRAIRLLDERGIDTLSTMIVGFPGETPRTVDNTIALLNAYPSSGRAVHRYLPFVFGSMPLAPATAPENRRRFGLRGLYQDWTHDSMSQPEAEYELRRLFASVAGPTLQYPDADPAGLTRPALQTLRRTREDLVKSGVTRIDETTIDQVVDTFRPLLATVVAA